jgi:putative DNA primase/helicase
MVFPKELTEKKQWICWRLIPDKDGGKDKKMPFDPVSGKAAASNNPDTWTDYDTAKDAVERYGYTGLGFMFSKEDLFVGVDIDGCCNKETGYFNEIATAILERKPTYAEFSPSGKGVHLFFKGELPSGGNKNSANGVEMYDRLRYFTMTGEKLKDSTMEIAEGGEVLKWIHETYIRPKTKERKKGKKKQKGKNIKLSDEELLERAQGSGDGETFTLLFEGKWQDSYESQSEADLALCNKLAFWAGKDKEQMDRLFRQSGLYREKWDKKHHASGATYGEETLDKAIEATEATYSPGGDAVIFEYDGRYFRSKGESIYPITNFLFRPLEMIVAEEETQLLADLLTTRGETFRLGFATTDFSNQQKFKGILNRKTIALSYFGSDGDLELLKGHISELDWSKKVGVKATGIYRHNKEMVFVSADSAVKAGEIPVTDIVQLEKYRSIDTSILNTPLLRREELRLLGEKLLTYNEPAKTVSVLAWMAGCYIKEHLRQSNIKYPHLMLIGEAGSGKSNTMERVILPVFSKTKVLAAGQITAFTLMKDSASSNLIPQALDEFKPSKLDKYKLDALYNHFRNSYDGHEGVRGRADQSTVSYVLLAPLVVAGEEAADETAIRERSIELLFSKKDIKPEEYQANFKTLGTKTELLGSFGRSLLEMALSTTYNEAKEWYAEGLRYFIKELPTRIINNLACCYAGLCLTEKLCKSLELSWNEVFPYGREPCAKYLEYAAKEYLLDGNTSNKSVVEQTLEIMSRMGLDPKSEYTISEDGKVLALWLNHVYDRYTKYRKDYAILGETLTYAQFKKQLKHCDFFLESNVQKKIGSDNRRVWTLNYAELKARCDVSGFEITEITPL